MGGRGKGCTPRQENETGGGSKKKPSVFNDHNFSFLFAVVANGD